MRQDLFEIPKLFYSDLTGVPMEKCISCEINLIHNEINYVIEKALKTHHGYKSYATIFEYAMCLTCVDKLKGNISAKSLQRIHQYFVQYIDLKRFDISLEDNDISKIECRMEKCMVNGKYVEELKECQIYAQCVGDKMIVREFPYMMSGQAMDDVVALLSSETLDDLNKLKDELIGPSEFQDLLKSGPKVFI